MLFRNTPTAVSPHVISHGWRPSSKHWFTYRPVQLLLVSGELAEQWASGHTRSVWLALTRTLSLPNWAFTQPCNINAHSYPLKLTPQPQQTFWDQMGSEQRAGKPTQARMHAIRGARKLPLTVVLKEVCRGQHCALGVLKCENERNRIL